MELKIGLIFSDFENYSKSAPGKISLPIDLVLYTDKIDKTAQKPRAMSFLPWIGCQTVVPICAFSHFPEHVGRTTGRSDRCLFFEGAPRKDRELVGRKGKKRKGNGKKKRKGIKKMKARYTGQDGAPATLILRPNLSSIRSIPSSFDLTVDEYDKE